MQPTSLTAVTLGTKVNNFQQARVSLVGLKRSVRGLLIPIHWSVREGGRRGETHGESSTLFVETLVQ